MRISRLQVLNLRCYLDTEVTFSPTITLFAGDNNSGKSTLIQALHILQNDSHMGPDSVRFGSDHATIFVDLEDFELTAFEQQNRQYITPGAKSVRIRVDFANQRISHFIQTSSGNAPFTPFPYVQPNNVIVPYLSDRRSLAYADQIGSQFAFRAGGTLQHLSAKVDRCLTSDELSDVFKDTCRTVFGFTISTQPSGSGKMAGLEINARRQQFIPLARLGSGIAQALGLIVELLAAEKKIFLIEELENDLHPTALRALLDLIERSASEGSQFILTTHSNIVVRRLGSIPGARIWHTSRAGSNILPESVATELPNEPAGRIELLRSLGYDLSDYELYDSWLITEESSAERIIKEFVIPWFAPKLSGRIRTIAAWGAADVEPRFVDLHRLFVFAHLEPIYSRRSWVLVDGDQAGQDALTKLRSTFSNYPAERFLSLSRHNFEEYYPAELAPRTQQVLAIPDKQLRRKEKAILIEEVVGWLRADPSRGRASLALSANEVIQIIQNIERQVAP